MQTSSDSATGPDEIHYQMLKHLPESSLQALLGIFNHIWTTGDFPEDWRLATVIPIPKPVDVYIPNPLRCYHCQVFGRHENKCGRRAVCCNCGEPEHCAPSGVCDKPAKCVNCSGDHPANSKQCPQWEKEKKILKIKCENNLSFPDARKQYEQFYTGQTYASAVKPGTCNKSTQTENKTTQTDDSFTEYLNRQQRKHKVQRKNVTHLLTRKK